MKRLRPRLLTCVYCSSKKKKKQPEGEGQVNRLLSVALTKCGCSVIGYFQGILAGFGEFMVWEREIFW